MPFMRVRLSRLTWLLEAWPRHHLVRQYPDCREASLTLIHKSGCTDVLPYLDSFSIPVPSHLWHVERSPAGVKELSTPVPLHDGHSTIFNSLNAPAPAG